MAKSWRRMDDNSLAAFDNGRRQTRETSIYSVYQEHGRPLTDREVKEFLDLEDMNDVRPVITRMMKAIPARLEKAGDAKDHKTGKTVRTVRIAGPTRAGTLFDENDLRGVRKKSDLDRYPD